MRRPLSLALRLTLLFSSTAAIILCVFGWLINQSTDVGQSTALTADSLDVLAGASVYGVALYAVGRSALMKISAGPSRKLISRTLSRCILMLRGGLS
jgi:Co/Zn/Cd efflux system component